MNLLQIWAAFEHKEYRDMNTELHRNNNKYFLLLCTIPQMYCTKCYLNMTHRPTKCSSHKTRSRISVGWARPGITWEHAKRWQQQADSSVTVYLIQVDHDVALGSSTAHNVLQHQGEQKSSGLRHVQVVGVILVPVLNRCHHLVIIRADYLQVLNKGDSRVDVCVWMRQTANQKDFKNWLEWMAPAKEKVASEQQIA